ncbi:hypothetical protein FACS189459_1340 [Bacilli bacterium]|nr:hypothetical protein FACS189459_1340 [Bacilli bacterium]
MFNDKGLDTLVKSILFIRLFNALAPEFIDSSLKPYLTSKAAQLPSLNSIIISTSRFSMTFIPSFVVLVLSLK